MTGLLMALVVAAGGVAALLLIGPGSPSRWHGSGKLALPGQVR